MAYKLVNAIFAGPIVQARIRNAFVDVGKASGVVISAGTPALESVHQILAYTAVRARIALTLVDVHLAMLAHESRHAVTRIPEKIV